MEFPYFTSTIYDYIESNGRISKKLFEKIVMPKLDRLIEIEKRLEEAEEVLEMVADNTKMPHQHTEPQLRLYCLAERANEYYKKKE